MRRLSVPGSNRSRRHPASCRRGPARKAPAPIAWPHSEALPRPTRRWSRFGAIRRRNASLLLRPERPVASMRATPRACARTASGGAELAAGPSAAGVAPGAECPPAVSSRAAAIMPAGWGQSSAAPRGGRTPGQRPDPGRCATGPFPKRAGTDTGFACVPSSALRPESRKTRRWRSRQGEARRPDRRLHARGLSSARVAHHRGGLSNAATAATIASPANGVRVWRRLATGVARCWGESLDRRSG